MHRALVVLTCRHARACTDTGTCMITHMQIRMFNVVCSEKLWRLYLTYSYFFINIHNIIIANIVSEPKSVSNLYSGWWWDVCVYTPLNIQFRHESSSQKLAFNFTDNNHIRPPPNKVTSMWDKYPVIQSLHFFGEPVRECSWTTPTDQTVAFCWRWLICFSPQMFGCGAVAQLVLSGGSHGMFLTVNFSFGFAATLGILVCGQVSGKPRNCQAQTISDTYLYLTKQCTRSRWGWDPNDAYFLIWSCCTCFSDRRPSESGCDLCPVPTRKRTMEKVPSILCLSDTGCIPGFCNHLRHVLWWGINSV